MSCQTGGTEGEGAGNYFSCKACETSGVCSRHGDGCMKLRTLLSAGKPNGRPLFSLLGNQEFNAESNSLSDAEVEKFHEWRLKQGGTSVLKEHSSGCSQFRAGDETKKKFATCGLFVSVCPHNVAGAGRRMGTVN